MGRSGQSRCQLKHKATASLPWRTARMSLKPPFSLLVPIPRGHLQSSSFLVSVWEDGNSKFLAAFIADRICTACQFPLAMVQLSPTRSIWCTDRAIVTNCGTDSDIGYLAPNAFIGRRKPEDEYFGHPTRRCKPGGDRCYRGSERGVSPSSYTSE